jgi:hypothetical protein
MKILAMTFSRKIENRQKTSTAISPRYRLSPLAGRGSRASPIRLFPDEP